MALRLRLSLGCAFVVDKCVGCAAYLTRWYNRGQGSSRFQYVTTLATQRELCVNKRIEIGLDSEAIPPKLNDCSM